MPSSITLYLTNDLEVDRIVKDPDTNFYRLRTGNLSMIIQAPDAEALVAKIQNAPVIDLNVPVFQALSSPEPGK